MTTDLIHGLASKDTLTLDKLETMLQEVKGMPVNPLDRVARWKVGKDVIGKIREVVRLNQAATKNYWTVGMEENPFVPRGVALGFSAKGELLVIVGVKQ